MTLEEDGRIAHSCILCPEEEERKNYICTIEGEESGASLNVCSPLPPLPSPSPFPVSPHCFNEWDSRPWFIYEEKPEGIQCFIEEQSFSPSYDLGAPPPPPTSPVSKLDGRYTGRTSKGDNLMTGKRGRGWGRSQIVRRQESLVLYKSFNTPCRKALNVETIKVLIFLKRVWVWVCATMERVIMKLPLDIETWISKEYHVFCRQLTHP